MPNFAVLHEILEAFAWMGERYVTVEFGPDGSYQFAAWADKRDPHDATLPLIGSDTKSFIEAFELYQFLYERPEEFAAAYPELVKRARE
jgi:hypothetical protein